MRRMLGVEFWAVMLVTAVIGCGDSESKPEANADGSQPGGPTTLSVGQTDPADRTEKQPPIDVLHPKVRFETSAGAFVVELDAEAAPLTVDNFLAYVDSGQYDGTIFHQVYDQYIVLGGGYTQDMQPIQTRTPIRNEAHNGLSNRRGTIAMARAPDVIDSASSQFFINLGDNAALDHRGRTVQDYGYCVFGQVIEGMEVLDQIGSAPVTNEGDFESIPAQPIVIRTARRVP